ncbi:ATP-dependent DNA helicase [Alloprevotella sp. OH1205_COT-284]|uniref:ATP-dependent helicase n=1 Tax=Alloprevotella sp. OH1205_COT-284 TaxID=2491043 RepID=UPI000F5D4EC1|nr:UvrD-helicase domain-containing protein [Alloprevotella sp. OH1205_COT-284]RRD76640.1 ATP-dependent DNA helicase [Alloprevotella sp. OH1205_COT-284]
MTDIASSSASVSARRPNEFWISELNGRQWEAVKECDKPLLVIAGAGSGKTRVLTYKIAYLLDHGYRPEEILALTFTNKAAREMNERIGKIVGRERSQGLWSGTFHSLFSQILRMEREAIGMKRDFSIYDASDSRSLIKSIVKEMGLDDKTYKPSRIQGRISAAKNHLLLPQDYAADASIMARDNRDNVGETHRIYAQYFQRCQTAAALDFDDLLLYTYLLFDRHEEIRLKYARRFRYLLVDEYQDTNFAQHSIIAQLTRENHRICVVGDDAQSIYSFRGANIDNILQFHVQYPESVTVKLEQNYRSTQNIVKAANSIIFHNKSQIEKTIFSDNAVGDFIALMPAASDREEAAKVVGTIARLKRKEAVDFDEIAILYRTNAQSRSFEDALRERNLPYRIYGGLSFYQRKEVKDIVAYCRLLNNLDDEEAFKRIVNYPARGIGNTTLQKLFSASREHGVSLWATAYEPDKYGVKLHQGTLNKLDNFCRMILDLRELLSEVGAFDLMLEVIHQTGIKNDLNQEDGPEGESKRENVEELLNSVRAFEQDWLEENGERFVPLTEFLQQSALQTDVDQKDDDTPKITLMTIHAAKGLEFEAVFVTGMEDGLFPGVQARLFPREMEEERRLFYVAVTRAKRFCFLSYAQTRFRYGSLERSEESPFVREIDSRFIREENEMTISTDRVTGTGFKPTLFVAPSEEKGAFPHFRGNERKTPASPRSDTPAAASANSRGRKLSRVSAVCSSVSGSNESNGLSAGIVIRHERFGKGTILAVEGKGDNANALVEFENVGRKKLLLKFAKFKVLES